MREDFYAFMFESHGFYVAAVEGLGMFRGQTLQELRTYVFAEADRIPEQKRSGGAIEFGLSKNLKPRYPLCVRCNGTGEVETDTYAGAQYCSIESAFDWSLRAHSTCPCCEGIGVSVAGFGTSDRLIPTPHGVERERPANR